MDQSGSVEPVEAVDWIAAHLALDLIERPQPLMLGVDHQTENRGVVLGILQASTRQPTTRPSAATTKPLYITAEWDDDHGQTAVSVSGSALTEPYALLLVDGLFEQAEAETLQKASKPGPTTRNRARGAKALSLAHVSIYEQMAEIQGGRSNYAHPALDRIRALHARRVGDRPPRP